MRAAFRSHHKRPTYRIQAAALDMASVAACRLPQRLRAPGSLIHGGRVRDSGLAAALPAATAAAAAANLPPTAASCRPPLHRALASRPAEPRRTPRSAWLQTSTRS